MSRAAHHLDRWSGLALATNRADPNETRQRRFRRRGRGRGPALQPLNLARDLIDELRQNGPVALGLLAVSVLCSCYLAIVAVASLLHVLRLL